MTDSGKLDRLAGLFRLDDRLFRRALDGFSTERSLVRPCGDTDHAASVALHLLDAGAYTASLLGEPPVEHGHEEVMSPDGRTLESIGPARKPRRRHRPHQPTRPVSASTKSPLEAIPGVGPSLSRDLRDLGCDRVEDLRDRDPEAMYAELCRLRGARVDPCVLYVFRCAVYFASREEHDPELLKWWRWKGRTLRTGAGGPEASTSSGSAGRDP